MPIKKKNQLNNKNQQRIKQNQYQYLQKTPAFMWKSSCQVGIYQGQRLEEEMSST